MFGEYGSFVEYILVVVGVLLMVFDMFDFEMVVSVLCLVLIVW